MFICIILNNYCVQQILSYRWKSSLVQVWVLSSLLNRYVTRDSAGLSDYLKMEHSWGGIARPQVDTVQFSTNYKKLSCKGRVTTCQRFNSLARRQQNDKVGPKKGMRNGYTNTHVRARRGKTECCFKTADTDTKLDALQGKKTITLRVTFFTKRILYNLPVFSKLSHI